MMWGIGRPAPSFASSGWRLCVSIPDPWQPGLYRWRDGQRYTMPELVDPEAERRIVHVPPPAPDDPLDGYTIMRAAP